MLKKLGSVYNSEDFIREYINSQSRDPRHLYLDKPAMHKAIPNLNGKAVLAIGCGDGIELNYLKKKGADKVVGIDSSKYMVARSKLNAPWAEIHKMSASNLDFKVESFDFVYSDLAIHYVRDIGKVFSEVYKILKKDGIFLFSTTHPIEDTLEEVKLSKHRKLKILGYRKIDGKINKVYGDYFTPRQIKNRWWKKNEVVIYYTPLPDIINEAIRAGFRIQQVLEPKPVDTMKRAYHNLYKRMSKIPFIIIFKLKK